MVLHIKFRDAEALAIASKFEALKSIETEVKQWMAAHIEQRTLWMPSDLLPCNESISPEQDYDLRHLRDRARAIPDHSRVSLALNILTEEGLPHFHRLLTTTVGNDSVWGKWNFMWTAEEDRHGTVLRDYVRDTRLFDMQSFDHMQYHYVQSGFLPKWDLDPYHVFSYTTLQEKATQVSHRNLAVSVAEKEPVIRKILTKLAGDETRHYRFYRSVLKRISEVDPNQALQSIAAVFPAIEMPGILIEKFREMSEVEGRTKIYSPWDYKKIVEEAIDYIKVPDMVGLNEMGRKAQEKIMTIPKRLEAVAKRISQRAKAKTFSFDFIYHRSFVLE